MAGRPGFWISSNSIYDSTLNNPNNTGIKSFEFEKSKGKIRNLTLSGKTCMSSFIACVMGCPFFSILCYAWVWLQGEGMENARNQLACSMWLWKSRMSITMKLFCLTCYIDKPSLPKPSSKLEIMCAGISHKKNREIVFSGWCKRSLFSNELP